MHASTENAGYFDIMADRFPWLTISLHVIVQAATNIGAIAHVTARAGSSSCESSGCRCRSRSSCNADNDMIVHCSVFLVISTVPVFKLRK